MLKAHEREQIRVYMEKGQMPAGFDSADWALPLDDWAVGQHAASLGYLDFDFDESALADYLGRPILPSGWTFAHEAAKRGLLPDGFDQWDLVTSQGVTVRNVALQAELPPAPGFTPCTREEINDLKHGWKEDPCWDLEFTEGFEAHAAELRTFRLAVEGEKNARHQKKIDEFAAKVGVTDNPALARYIFDLHHRTAMLEEKIEQLGKIVTENSLAQKSHRPKF